MSDIGSTRKRKPLPSYKSAGQPARRSAIAITNGKHTSKRPSPGSSQHLYHDKGTNIQVVLRCRGRNEAELAADSPVILEPNGHREVLLTTNNRMFTFDRVFDQHATQEHIYNEVAQPILDQVLEGYTMEGNLHQNTHDGGIIPRVIDKLFAALDQQGKEYSVKVSLLELYNEELRDLLNPTHNQPGHHIKLYEDKITSGIIVQGMEEKYIDNAQDGLNVLRQGIRYRSVGATKINEKSSRSHCIFSLVAHIRESVPGGEDVFRVGKLNLVDLAGSENVLRSGAEHQRAREAGMINQSLLTLGRVINQLVEQSSHIPYRESKLTRLLKDSLGGRTRTCIIATVSIAKMNQEEILSTLDYANRAKNIRNRPETNQPTNRNVHIRDLELKIEQLKADLQASYEKNGVYMTHKSYEGMKDEAQQLKDGLKDKQDRLDKARMDVLNADARCRDALAKMDTLERDYDRKLEQIKKEEQESRTKHMNQMASFLDAWGNDCKALQKEIHTIGKRHTQVYQKHIQDDQSHLQGILQGFTKWKTMIEESMVQEIRRLKHTNKAQVEMFEKEKEQEDRAWAKVAKLVADIGESRRSSLANTSESVNHSLLNNIDLLELLQRDMRHATSKHTDQIEQKKEEIAALEHDLKIDHDRHSKVLSQFYTLLTQADAQKKELRTNAPPDSRKRSLDEPENVPIPTKRTHH
ncbi:kinesin-domain-containing protein [Hesseltinella vesiculosa]|uniref:Kinesin-like protein n=1 Tax=Hesseltinella vesiculosa TaxID=101127 RepID=A0A1X2GPI4_9FUNG|nr:kinesin-domain-containing protein [Hesseltinella vesiculosa]